MIFGFNKEEFSELIHILSGYSSITEAIIFGSRAMGNYKKGSDVDIALKGCFDGLSISRISRILNDETNLPYKFDIIDYGKISNNELISHISEYGKTILKNGKEVGHGS